ncbi:3-isopropylmalate dehydratase small subunit [Shouchella clausii]|jgi:3-isopropylmalate/(R)-2-methylmalate dehydratase small subunit|uniref:3-isopropylmalate dehydratase small subunit n=1 Tax=Shouchella clausii (strain KSM-K16) TaxID=66692 RepID=LEUD_SHOC1|nr:3-isopropylmalate dehydratase small subunit [Shouchella clausii]Q5WEN6.1 RecName: Full=3-isopropylmalate dehydratase small subunit; AltName: Full=Alpha-IPM isomerase; Short=IPMI; AltName: Full=Isopropylmalate isomerase [Shouchella clausii KSM-K16]KKI87725.1 isopropylmalate isomerase [Shouchella clausii]PAD47224.1 3-isopropylmalate dehydratase small subunit [Shouchella clausii]PAF10675.1 3-isopropylmalate dehydratase small subunit [Shouchella clausii]BAD65174.1 3-isopropylmalate dehydratase 
MEPIQVHKGKAVVLDRVNIDTDQIIPKQFLKRVERTGFGQYLFYDWRFQADGADNPAFELNQPEANGASILITGHNFGCGSSREHAPWALYDYGFRVIIAPSFADIFYNNCVKNGLLPIRLSPEETELWMERAKESQEEITVDLGEQLIKQNGLETKFEMDSYWKQMLYNGWDEISLTLQYEEAIAKYEHRQSAVNK